MGKKCSIIYMYAGVSESADEADSKSVACKGVWVQVPPPAPFDKYLN